VRNVSRVSSIRESARTFPSERQLVVIVSEIRRLSRTITVPLERELKRAGYFTLESYEVLREIRESGDVHLTSGELQTRLSVPQHRMSRLIDRLAKAGYVEREKTPDARSNFVVITDLGRRALEDALSVISAAVRRFFYRKNQDEPEGHSKRRYSPP
jgi:DNA-binding MarR family transcriptional regulator